MAYNYKIEYITTSRRNVFRGLSYPMSSGNEGGYLAESVDKTLLVNGLVQGILTQKGERVMLPNFGTTLKLRLFNPITEDSKLDIKREIEELILFYYPRIRLNALRVGSGEIGTPGLDPHTIYIQLDVKFKDSIFEDEEINILVA